MLVACKHLSCCALQVNDCACSMTIRQAALLEGTMLCTHDGLANLLAAQEVHELAGPCCYGVTMVKELS